MKQRRPRKQRVHWPIGTAPSPKVRDQTMRKAHIARLLQVVRALPSLHL